MRETRLEMAFAEGEYEEAVPPESDFRKYRKKTLTEAQQIPFSFRVLTLEGTMEGQPGDYLMRGAAGELYPCAKEVFDQTYEEA